MSEYAFLRDLAVVTGAAGLAAWTCRRIGLSVIVGYLVAGLMLGPSNAAWSPVEDRAQVAALAQVGLVVLMFSIGMGLSVRRLKALGVGLMVATASGAVLIFNCARVLAAALGLEGAAVWVLAGMVMVSSSAIIAKVLAELDLQHEGHGQAALGITVLEDAVAVVMLTLLGAVLGGEAGGGGASVGGTLWVLAGFVLALGVTALLFVPRLLRRVQDTAGDEVRTLVVAGLLFSVALLAWGAGYSLALGAFLLGVVVAESEHRPAVERAFEGLRDVFSAVFFVSIGMLLSLEQLLEAWPWILGLTAFALVARPLAIGAALVLTGSAPRDALRVGLIVTPLGEFSFIIARQGADAGAVPEAFFPAAVGVSILTSILAPVLVRSADRVAVGLAGRPGARWLAVVEGYHALLGRLAALRETSLLWRLLRRRVVQVGAGLLLVAGLLAFSERLADAAVAWLGRDWLFPEGPRVVFWCTLALVVAPPLLAVWRNLSAMAMIVGEAATRGHGGARRMRPVLTAGLQMAAALGLANLVFSLLPVGPEAWWVGPLLGGLVLAAMVFFGRRLVRLHSEAEVELEAALTAGEASRPLAPAWLRTHGDWGLNLGEAVLPENAASAGKSLRELALRQRTGVAVVEVDRQGRAVTNPGPDFVVFPRDRLLLLGSQEQIDVAVRLLGDTTRVPVSDFSEALLEVVPVGAGSGAAGRTLAELDLGRRFEVTVVAWRRAGRTLEVIDPREPLAVDDELLVLGAPRRQREFRRFAAGAEPAAC